MPYYIKVTKKVKEALLPPSIVGTRTADGNYLLYQSAISSVTGKTLSERAETVGGAMLTQLEAKEEIKGTDSPAYCYTPKMYGGDEDESSSTEDNDHLEVSPVVSNTVQPVYANDNNINEESEVIDE